MTTHQLVAQLKADEQDFEWYPTTEKMLECIVNDMRSNIRLDFDDCNLLDIGAGDCRLGKLMVACQSDKEFRNPVRCLEHYFVIEKAFAHLKAINDFRPAVLVGTDFYDTDLTSIDAHITFCNPPYSQFVEWTCRILTTVKSPIVYMVIPERWQQSTEIKKALASRKDIEFEVLLTDDFLDGERQARAKIEVVRFSMIKKGAYDDKYTIKRYSLDENDPTAQLLGLLDKEPSEPIKPKTSQELQVIFEQDKLTGLINDYNYQRHILSNDLQTIQCLSADLMNRLGIGTSNIVQKLRADLNALKLTYWQAFFNCYEPIKSRLTAKSREHLYRYLRDNSQLEFTYTNCQAVTIIAIHRANSYFESQLKELFENFACADNLANYKSNQKVFSDGDYRYQTSRDSNKADYYHHTALEYRLVNSYYARTSWDFDNTANNIVNDLAVVARTLGFNIPSFSVRKETGEFVESEQRLTAYSSKLVVGEKYQVVNDCDDVVLFDIKFFKKGTYHIRLNQEFCLRLNVALGKLYGWLRDEQDLSEIKGAKAEHWHALAYITTKTLALPFVETDE